MLLVARSLNLLGWRWYCLSGASGCVRRRSLATDGSITIRLRQGSASRKLREASAIGCAAKAVCSNVDGGNEEESLKVLGSCDMGEAGSPTGLNSRPTCHLYRNGWGRTGRESNKVATSPNLGLMDDHLGRDFNSRIY